MKLTPENLTYLSHCSIAAAKLAGEVVAGYADKKLEVHNKVGGESLASQVVTEADLHSEAIIIKALQPTIGQYDLGVLTEENEDNGERLSKDYFWCIDPIDGTLSFIEGVPGYAISIALVSKAGEPIIGVVYDPLSKTIYSAVKGQGAFRNGKPWVLPPSSLLTENPLTLIVDRSLEAKPFYKKLLKQFESIAFKVSATDLRTMHKGGAVMNGCWVLENPPSCYFKFPKQQNGGGSSWDFAAIACLFRELGAIATDFFGQPLKLNSVESTFMNKHGVLFSTNQSLISEIRRLDIEP